MPIHIDFIFRYHIFFSFIVQYELEWFPLKRFLYFFTVRAEKGGCHFRAFANTAARAYELVIRNAEFAVRGFGILAEVFLAAARAKIVRHDANPQILWCRAAMKCIFCAHFHHNLSRRKIPASSRTKAIA
ncbi:hypothetical protein [Azospirillum doebereinerae]